MVFLVYDPDPVILLALLSAGGYVANGAQLTVSGGSAFALGNVGYLHTDGTVRLGSPSGTEAQAQIAVVCLAAAGVADAASGLFGFGGCLVTGLSGLTPPALYYLAASGGITATPPASGYSVIIGRAISATSLHFSPRDPFNLG